MVIGGGAREHTLVWKLLQSNRVSDIFVAPGNAGTTQTAKNLDISATNLDAIYNGWSSRPVKPNLSINFGTAKYTSASSAGKAILTTSPNNWTCTDGGLL